MAIEWYRIDAGLKNHPKRIRVSKVTGCSKLEALAYITLLFTFTATYAEDGGVNSFSPSEIEDACEWSGKEGLLYQAFVEAALIDETENGRIVHNWYEKNWKHVEEKRRRNHTYRESKKAKDHQEDNSGSSQSQQEERNERTNERTDLYSSSPQGRIDHGRLEFARRYAGHPAYKGRSYSWTSKDFAASNFVLYGDQVTKKFPPKEELDRGLENFFASDAKWTADHSAHSFFNNYNKFVTGPSVDFRGPAMGRGDAKGGRQSKLSGFGAGKKIEGKGKGVAGIDWNADKRDGSKSGAGQTAAPQAGGDGAKV